ncbi:MAG TPA: nitrite/sulfite reductase, partial [Pseudomonadales bacterium]|nr:nitrite/sulfite reductase [Pseudomonadales bacterium]
TVQMHAIQTSGNCIRNVTSDQFAGIAPDEVVDPRPYCELIRQWSTFHPEFAYLPRKFKIAVNGAKSDRAAIAVHDIGVQLDRNAQGEVVCQIWVGGGLGRTPVIGTLIRDQLPERHLLGYLEAILRVYNMLGRRDNKYKARIKILVKALGAEEFTRLVEAQWNGLRDGAITLTREEIERVQGFFTPPAYATLADRSAELAALAARQPAFGRWLEHNVMPHKQPGYAAVTLSLKRTGIAPGDLDDWQMEAVADLADRFSFGELRVSHEQNLILADVRQSELEQLWQQLEALHLATPNIGTLNDIICCPGGDFCSLANAKSIPIAEAIQRRFDDIEQLYALGRIDLNISGCMNACGHHHVGHIGILGVDKKGAEYYQISLGGSAGEGEEAALGDVMGPSFSQQQIPDVIEKIVKVYVEQRATGEKFIDTYRRVGLEPFKEQVYGPASH